MSRSNNSRRGIRRQSYAYDRSQIEHDRRRIDRAAETEMVDDQPKGDRP